MTKSGKSWLLKRLVKKLLNNHEKVLVYSGVADKSWPRGVKLTFNHDVFENMLADPKNYGAHVIVDEASILFRQARSPAKHPNIHELASAGRHCGYTAYFATQKPTRLDSMIRENCGECYCFRLGSKKSAKLVYEDYGDRDYNGVPLFELIGKQKPLEYIHINSNTDKVTLGVL